VTLTARIAGRLHLWIGIVSCLALLCLYDGAGYAVGGDAAGNNAPALAVLRAIPGLGLRFHGIALLALGAALAYGLGRARAGEYCAVRRALLVLIFYAVWTVCAIAATWLPFLGLDGAAWGAPSKWAFAGAVALLSVACTPASSGRGRPDARR